MYEEVISKLEKTPNLLKIHAYPTFERMMFAPYMTKVILEKGEKGLFGRGAMHCLKEVRTFGDLKDHDYSVKVGHFTEAALNCNILTGGEHKNKQVINNSLTCFADIQKFIETKSGQLVRNCYSRGPVTIGANVTISANVTILSGVTIGDGAVLGASAVVTKDVPPFAIVAGNPAKVIKYRFDEKTIEALLKIRWWDFKFGFFLNHYADIQNITEPGGIERFANIPPEVYEEETTNYIVFGATRLIGGAEISYIGAEMNGKLIEKANLPPEFNFFAEQMYAKPGTTVYLIKDIFKYAGLTS